MHSSDTVPVIDISPFRVGVTPGALRVAESQRAVIDQVRQALETIGFFVITGHGLAPDLQARTLRVAREFFDLPEDEKLRYCEVPRSFMGYNPVGAERVAYAHHDESAPDLKANFTMGRMDMSMNATRTTAARPAAKCSSRTSGPFVPPGSGRY